jgi:hypothetical protein
MEAAFSIDVDGSRSLVRIVMSGFFSVEDIVRFVAARDRAHQLLNCGLNAHVTLVDIRGMKIQSQDSVESFKHVLNNPKFASRRLAIVVAQSLARMQIKRAASEREAQYFDSIEGAEAWLLAPDAAPTDTPLEPVSTGQD